MCISIVSKIITECNNLCINWLRQAALQKKKKKKIDTIIQTYFLINHILYWAIVIHFLSLSLSLFIYWDGSEFHLAAGPFSLQTKSTECLVLKCCIRLLYCISIRLFNNNAYQYQQLSHVYRWIKPMTKIELRAWYSSPHWSAFQHSHSLYLFVFSIILVRPRESAILI